MSTRTNQQAKPTDFASFLAANLPDTAAELSTELRALVARVEESEAKGTLTLTVTVKPHPDVSGLLITDEIKVRALQRPRRGLIAHVDPDGNLTTDDPNAFSMFRDVDPDTGEVS